ncbi:hypothetical protein HK096_009579 [Nowakowskiella sp. JEL0078]|nr:hypothetical protein HK096_009579 [Nowakowskiella sp. JEL0078]
MSTKKSLSLSSINHDSRFPSPNIQNLDPSLTNSDIFDINRNTNPTSSFGRQHRTLSLDSLPDNINQTSFSKLNSFQQVISSAFSDNMSAASWSRTQNNSLFDVGSFPLNSTFSQSIDRRLGSPTWTPQPPTSSVNSSFVTRKSSLRSNHGSMDSQYLFTMPLHEDPFDDLSGSLHNLSGSRSPSVNGFADSMGSWRPPESSLKWNGQLGVWNSQSGYPNSNGALSPNTSQLDSEISAHSLLDNGCF